MTTATLILNIALMVAVTLAVMTPIIVMPNLDRITAWMRRTPARRVRATATRDERTVRGALPTAS